MRARSTLAVLVAAVGGASLLVWSYALAPLASTEGSTPPALAPRVDRTTSREPRAAHQVGAAVSRRSIGSTPSTSSPTAAGSEPTVVASREAPAVPGATDDELRCVGRVVAREDGAAIGDATIAVIEPRFSSHDEDALAPKAKPWRETRGLADGRFEIEGSSSRGHYLRVGAAGFAPALVRLDREHATIARELIVRLGRSASLSARVVDRQGEGTAAVSLVATTRGDHLAHREPGEDFGATNDEVWTAPVEPDGVARLVDLAPRVPLELSVRRGRRTVLQLAETVTLEPGERREIELALGGGAAVAVTVIDDRGRPCADVDVWMVAPSACFGSRMLASHCKPARRGRTDVEGSVELADAPAGSWFLGPAPTDLTEDDTIAPFADVVVVEPGAARVDVRLVAHRGLYVRGKLLASGGEPVETRVHAFNRELCVAVVDRSEADGSFELGPLPRCELELTAGGSDGFAPTTPFAVRAGEHDVVVPLAAGASIVGRVVDADGDVVAQAQLRWTREDCELGETSSTTARAGEFEIGSLRSGVWHVVALASGDRIGFARIELDDGERAAQTTIAVRQGARIELRASALATCSVRSSGAVVAVESIGPNTATSVVVPAGETTVEARIEGSAAIARRTVTLAPGESVSIDVTEPR